jgi:hypothetical protein
MAIEVSRAARVTDGPSRHRVIGSGGAAYWLSAALGVAAAASSLLTFAVPSLLRGTAVMNGSARGTALPASPVASGALVPAFATLAVIGLIPACLLLHGLSGGVPGVTAAPRSPAAARYGWHPWRWPGWTA